ncbi:hypothetical protein [Martelella endophytica]|uniref:DNA-binding protein n=1 Tax=Martelella endophytica TaxID=1486262 RepID=A0A0D5LR93_MAREN|nr:hypothetical protein [Martelella endophytica]AJY46646.1 hypothetical protein TM49_14715 [Martelella endophytica]
MISARQIRAARALLGFTDDHLAALAGLDIAALQAAETDAAERDFQVIEALEAWFEKEGVAFIEDGESGGGPGVRLKHSIDPCDGIRPEDLNSANDG